MKKFLSILLVLMLCLSAVTCLAAPAGPKGPAAGPKPGPAAPAPKPGPAAPGPKPAGPVERDKANKIIDAANAKIAAYVAQAQATAEDDVAWLIAVTNAVADQAKAEVAALGLTAGCNLVVYVVDGQEVAIDPLYVINDPTKPRPPITTQVGEGK